jgi:predicted transcriptional regulator
MNVAITVRMPKQVRAALAALAASDHATESDIARQAIVTELRRRGRLPVPQEAAHA